MASFSPNQYNFKYPKPLLEPSNNVSSKKLLSPHRPQPAPSRRQLLMKELGLDQVDDVESDEDSDSITFSDDDDGATILQMIDGPTKAEFESLQKDRDNLIIKNKELQDQLRLIQGLLQREETKRQRHVKILKKAQSDLLKDKDQLITNLEDIIFDNELKIRQLEDDLKGNPIKPIIEKPPQTSSIQKLLDSIKSLHHEKSTLCEKVLSLEQNVEEKSTEILNFQQNSSPSAESLKRENSRTDNEKVVEKLRSEISELKCVLDEREKELIDERESSELASDKVDQLERKIKKVEEERKKSEKKLLVEIEELSKEVESKNSEISELETKPPKIVTKTVERVVEIESTEQKSEINNATSKIFELEHALEEKEGVLTRNKDEITRLKYKVNKNHEEIASLRSEMQDSNSTYLEEEAKLRLELRKKEAELKNERKQVEKGKKNLKSEQAKLSELEQELQEVKESSKRARDNVMVEIDSLKKKLLQKEKAHEEELNDAMKTAECQKVDAESLIDRLEKNIRKTEERLENAENVRRTLTEKLENSSRKLDTLSDELKDKDNLLASRKSRIIDLEDTVAKEKQKLDDLQQKLITANGANETLHAQVKDLSGATDVATVELSTLRSENSSLKMDLTRIQSLNKGYVQDLSNCQQKQGDLLLQQQALEDKLDMHKSEHKKESNLLKENHMIALENAKSEANTEVRSVSSKLHKMHYSLRHLLSSIHSINKENQHLKKECSKFPSLIEDALRQAEKKINDSISEMNENSKELIRKYKKEMQLRKKYHNELVELKGNIRVFARVRPTISEDGSGDLARNAVTYDRDDDGVIYVHNSQRGRSTLFELDKVFQPNSTQFQVYSEVQSLVTSCVDGYHVCIFAYGQTGSGKTYTMEGPVSDPGINQRALGDLFNEVEDKSADWDYKVRVSLVEIYNEALKDLLRPASAKEKLEIKMNADGSLFVPGLTEKEVTNLDEVNSLFSLGHKNRATACTNMNEHSSRSHAVLIVYVTGVNITTGSKTHGKLNLIDLAGSERVSKSGASGDRLKEAQNINKSLSALGDVIQALGAKQPHIPYRNSKLTYLLQDSLSKDSKTLMLVQVAPVEKNVSETICSLSFAQRVRKVELGQANKKIGNSKSDDSAATPKKGLKISQGNRKK